MKRILLIITLFICFLLAWFLLRSEKKKDGALKAYEIILYSKQNIPGYKNRYITFEYPNIDNGIIEFYCSERGCKNTLRHQGSFKIHEVHIDKDLNILE